jgi:eukaryotic-like serine/threonine-protein kinase
MNLLAPGRNAVLSATELECPFANRFFALRLIFYEMLTGLMPFKADSAIASLIRRTQERVSPVSDHDNSIPASVSSIVAKCLERDLDQRYKTATDLLADLDSWQGKRAAATLRFEPKVGPW